MAPAGPAPIELVRVRCECRVCGAHTYAVSGIRLYGSCSNCRSVELVQIDPPSPSAAA